MQYNVRCMNRCDSTLFVGLLYSVNCSQCICTLLPCSCHALAPCNLLFPSQHIGTYNIL